MWVSDRVKKNSKKINRTPKHSALHLAKRISNLRVYIHILAYLMWLVRWNIKIWNIYSTALIMSFQHCKFKTKCSTLNHVSALGLPSPNHSPIILQTCLYISLIKFEMMACHIYHTRKKKFIWYVTIWHLKRKYSIS